MGNNNCCGCNDNAKNEPLLLNQTVNTFNKDTVVTAPLTKNIDHDSDVEDTHPVVNAQLDLSVFDETAIVSSTRSSSRWCQEKGFLFAECKRDNGDIIEGCISLKRIFTALRYYSTLDIVSNEDHREKFTYFMNESYHKALDDYTHLVIKHDEHLYEIKEALLNTYNFKVCAISQCQYSSRHHRNEENKENVSDPVFNFNKTLMDSLHFFTFHLFECGMRSIKDLTKHDEEKTDDEYYDVAFSRLTRTIKDARANTTSFERLKNNDKFNIEVNNDVETENQKGRMYLDEMITYLRVIGIGNEHISQLHGLFVDQQYDSESVQYDMENDNNESDYKGNISNCIQNEHAVATIKQFIDRVQAYSSSFNVGLTFYYWRYYEGKKSIPQREQHQTNINAHDGYDLNELYIPQKYESFKEEISYYPHFEMHQYHEVVTKAKEYENSESAKHIRSRYLGAIWDTPHYDDWGGHLLGFSRIMALILYCDYSALSTDFSASMRPSSPFEPLTVTKKKNGKYWWMSKLLRETVELFGSRRCWNEGKESNQGLVGPFYCGMSRVMVFPAFNIRLNSPTSTSTKLEVALNFCGDDGMVIQLNNNSCHDKEDYLRGFNCSWISQYKEEDERLFFGGYWRIKVQCIRIPSTGSSYELFNKAFYYLDAMLTGAGWMGGVPVNSKTIKILRSMIQWKTGENMNQPFDEYVYKMFDGYIKNKTHINVHLWELKVAANKEMIDLILCGVKEWETTREEVKVDSRINLLRAEVMQMFVNVKSVLLQSTAPGGDYVYYFSFIELLSLIETTSWERITIKAKTQKGDDSNWISRIAESPSIKNAYNEKNYTISLEHVAHNIDFLIIDKM